VTARVLIGPDSAKAADKLIKDRQALWPYTHLFPPPGSIPVHQIGYLAVPAPAAGLTSILAYQVPEGFRFWMHGILQCYTLNGAPGPFNPGDTFWTVDVNAPGIPNVQGTLVQGLVRVPVPLGSWLFGTQWRFDMPYEFAPLDLVQSKALNVNLGVGGQNFYVSGLFGYLVPAVSK